MVWRNATPLLIKDDMWQNKLKAVTFSFDDGVTQDERLIEILNKYNLKGTFNLNFDLLGCKNTLERNGKIVRHDKVYPMDVKRIYSGHEVAAHV
jgi:peptidoglycan/xylan/chitin deacetylase (PgdA/CDA1 family)